MNNPDEITNINKELENEADECVVVDDNTNKTLGLGLGFNVSKTNYKNGLLITFTFLKSVSDDDFLKFLALLDKLINEKIKFALQVDTRLCTSVPFKASLRLISWMKKRKEVIPYYLLGSSVVIKSKVIVNLVSSAFKIQKPTRPNLLTSDFNKSKMFLEKLLVE
jgi:hypothetical protein